MKGQNEVDARHGALEHVWGIMPLSSKKTSEMDISSDI